MTRRGNTLDCPRCHATGDEPPNRLARLLTLGLWALIERSCLPVPCTRCGGRGWVRIDG